MDKKDKLIYISVYKLEDEALNAINKLYRQGFRRDQVSVLAYNTDRFNHLYRDAAVPMSEHETLEDLPEEVEDALTPDVILPIGVANDPMQQGAGYPGVHTLAPAGLAALELDDDTMLAHERSLKDGDILVILQTDEGQAYRPDMPLIHDEGYMPERKEL